MPEKIRYCPSCEKPQSVHISFPWRPDKFGDATGWECDVCATWWRPCGHEANGDLCGRIGGHDGPHIDYRKSYPEVGPHGAVGGG